MGPESWWGHGFGFMWIIPLIFLVVFLFIMREMFGRSAMGCGSHRDNSTHHESARDILDKQFAKEVYEEMKKTLGNGPS